MSQKFVFAFVHNLSTTLLKLKFFPSTSTINFEQDTTNASPSTQQVVPRRRLVPVHQSRILDRPVKVNEKDSNIKIKIELDLEVEVEIYARVKGDVYIGLM